MRRARWAPVFLSLLLLVALLGGLIANDRPLIMSSGGQLRFPVWSSASISDGYDEAVDWAIYAPISYGAGRTDLGGSAYLPPLSRGADGGLHWLGTDRLGRDTAAGLVAGTRLAVLVGLGSLAIALLLGVPLGAISGFYGDRGLRVPAYGYWALVLGLVLGIGYGVASVLPLTRPSGVGWLLVLVTVGLVMGATWLLLRVMSQRLKWLRRSVGLPLDRCVLMLLELSASVPGLIVMIVVLALVERPSMGVVILVLGVLGWTSVARYLRAELLRIRELPYIAAARVSGVGRWRLLVVHALPNALGPLSVVAAFLVGSSILAEAALSFLGIGVPADTVTWGSLLRQSRAQPTAWWLAVFPGLMLTFTVLACNSLRKAAE